MPSDVLAAFKRYAQQIESLLQSSKSSNPGENESAITIRVDRGAVLATAVGGKPTAETPMLIDRLIEVASSSRLADMRVVDSAGHSRAAYRPAMVYACLQSYRLLYETLSPADFGRWEEGLRPWADLLESDLGATSWPAASLPASAGDRWAEMAWDALALHVAGKIFVRDAWTDLAADTFGKLYRAQQPSGGFLKATPADQPETLWYHELQFLHAAAAFAVISEDRSVASAVARAGEFHQKEMQPDHATSQPWGLFAFIWNAETRPLADQLLHSVTLQQPGTIDGVSLMLLADCLYCLQLFSH